MAQPDEFDPFIERLFSRTPQMADADIFAASVEQRLASGGRMRATALWAAGLVGGIIAVRETIGANFSFGPGPEAASQGVRMIETAPVVAATRVQGGLDQIGLGGVDLTSMAGMQLFWVAAACLIAAAAFGTLKLVNEV